jgi:hypothetical protein
MPRTDKSISILTGMIIAALYVILFMGFAQETLMRRDAANRVANASRGAAGGDVASRGCRAEPAERQSCAISIEAVRRYLSEPAAPLALQSLHRATREEP